ncbi:MAG: helix-turn-helix transcriptional regulator [Bacteroidales bacterium]|nr:helix-turn-helix transcriptional regulator [Bacteroidales bacterium]
MTDSERVKLIEKTYELSTNALAKALNLKSAQTLYDIHKGKHGISKELAEKIHAKYLNINPTWLLTGVGDMFNAKPSNELDKSEKKQGDTVTMPREVFDMISRLTETILSQQRVIESDIKEMAKAFKKTKNGNCDAGIANAV